MESSIININNLSEEELNEFVFKFLSLLKNGVSDHKEELFEVINEKLSDINSSHKRLRMLNDKFKKITRKSYKQNIIEGLFELISFFEKEEEYENCAMLKKIKDNLLMDF
tara:strand:+ start:268 stop:597 length:330 start_codon:yes stop_codon:yes gene_type:complete